MGKFEKVRQGLICLGVKSASRHHQYFGQLSNKLPPALAGGQASQVKAGFSQI